MPTEYIKLEPNYENTIKWFAEGLADHSFDKGALDPPISLMEQAVYLAHKDPNAYARAMQFLKDRAAARKEQTVVRMNRFIRYLPEGMSQYHCLGDHDGFDNIHFEAPTDWKGLCEWHNADGTFDREAYLEMKKGGPAQD